MPGKVFISYSRKDADWLALATEHLGAIELEAWDDTRIGPGEDWLPAIERAMAECQFALLLVSASYLSSPFIKRTEIPALLQRRAAEGLTVIPVLVRPCSWSKVDWLARINMRPKGDKALSSLGKPKAEAELAALAGEIAGLLETAAAARQREAPHVDLHHLPEGAADFLGRGADLEWLDAQWQTAGAVSVAVLVAPGGTGKTSLLRRWLQRLKVNGWGGAQRVFAYSFYRQGVSDASPATATDEPFLNAVLTFFGVRCEDRTSAWDRGRRLAEALMAQRALLVLDGVEPLQDAGSHRLRTDGLKALLTTLADAGRQSLCVLSTRAEIADLQHYGVDGAVRCRQLDNLCAADGARLLHRLGVRRIGGQTLSEDEAAQDATYHRACQTFGGHALTLHILGLYLASRMCGDLRRLDRADLLKVDAACKSHPNHAFHVMHAYECWLEQGGERGVRQLAVLRLLGLFDRPATPDCVWALREPPIAGLTDVLQGLSYEDWNALLHELQTAGLVQRARWQQETITGYNDRAAAEMRMEATKNYENFPLGPPQIFTPEGIDVLADAETLNTHPLIREYFAKRLADGVPNVASAGHVRLYNYLCASMPYWPDGETGLAPLYQAVVHGCRAGQYRDACVEVYQKRILRGNEFYAINKLGLFGAELSAIASFFVELWRTPIAAPMLGESERAWLLNVAAFRLRALGRLREAVEPARTGLNMREAQQDWEKATRSVSNLSELHLALGELQEAIKAAECAVKYAKKSGDAFQYMSRRSLFAYVQAQKGDVEAALDGFIDAEKLWSQRTSQYPRLCSLRGFRYCDTLLLCSERSAWVAVTGLGGSNLDIGSRLVELQDVTRRAAQTLGWAQESLGPLAIALDHLTLARAELYRAWLLKAYNNSMVLKPVLEKATIEAREAIDWLRKTGDTTNLCHGLLTRACVHHGNKDAAFADLIEAQRIAERGGMKLHLADVHLHRARLFRDREALDAARKLIDATGYERRRGELDDAQCLLDGRPIVLPEFASVLTRARGENLLEPPPATDPTP